MVVSREVRLTPGSEAPALFDNRKERHMERTVALKKLEKLLGKKMGWRINPKAPTAEERTAAKLALPAARAHGQVLDDPR